MGPLAAITPQRPPACPTTPCFVAARPHITLGCPHHHHHRCTHVHVYPPIHTPHVRAALRAAPRSHSGPPAHEAMRHATAPMQRKLPTTHKKQRTDNAGPPASAAMQHQQGGWRGRRACACGRRARGPPPAPPWWRAAALTALLPAPAPAAGAAAAAGDKTCHCSLAVRAAHHVLKARSPPLLP